MHENFDTTEEVEVLAQPKHSFGKFKIKSKVSLPDRSRSPIRIPASLPWFGRGPGQHILGYFLGRVAVELLAPLTGKP